MGDDCREVLDRLQTFLDGECPQQLEEVIHAHIGDCPPCLDRAEFERELRVIVARKCKEAAPEGLVDRVISALQQP